MLYSTLHASTYSTIKKIHEEFRNSRLLDCLWASGLNLCRVLRTIRRSERFLPPRETPSVKVTRERPPSGEIRSADSSRSSLKGADKAQKCQTEVAIRGAWIEERPHWGYQFTCLAIHFSCSRIVLCTPPLGARPVSQKLFHEPAVSQNELSPS